MELFIIGWKNIFRNKRRTALNIAALTIGISLMIIGIGWVRGYFEGLYQGMIDLETGHIHVMHQDYREEARRLPLDLNIQDADALRSDLLDIDGVVEAGGRINFSLRISNGTESTFVQGRAIEPERESSVTILDEYIQAGDYLSPEDNGVLVGASLAQRLNVEAGDIVFLTARDRHGVENFIDARVTGIYEYGYPAVDNYMVFLPMTFAQGFLNMEGMMTKLVIRLEEGLHAEDRLDVVAQAAEEHGYRAYNWKDFAQVMVSTVQADTGSFYIILGILFLLIIIGILNSMSMAVQERTGEISTLRAIGMRKTKLSLMFLYESISLGILASVIGIIITLPVAYWLQVYGIDVSGYLPEDIPIPFGEALRSLFLWTDFLYCALAGIATAVLGSIFPARRAAKMNIAQTMSGR